MMFFYSSGRNKAANSYVTVLQVFRNLKFARGRIFLSCFYSAHGFH